MRHHRSRTFMIFTALALLIGLVVPRAAWADTSCGPSGCGVYHLYYDYAGGGSGSISYVSQYEWLVGMSHIDERAYLQESGVVKLTLLDGQAGGEITATFCPPGQPRCIGTYGYGVGGGGGWTEYRFSGPYCQMVTDPDTESAVLAQYLTDVAYTVANYETGARILAAPTGNEYGVGSCGVVT